MAKGQAIAKKPRRWGLFTMLGCFGLPLTICAVGGFFLNYQVGSIANRLPEEVAKLKAMGVPTEAADLAPNPQVSQKDNAAELYGAISYRLDALAGDKAKGDVIKLLDGFSGANSNPADLGKVLQAIQSNQDIFSDAEKLSAKTRIDFKRTYEKGYKLLFPEFAGMKRLAKWQCSKAKAEWMSANRKAALSSLAVAFRIGEHASQEPHVIGQLVSIAIHAIAHRTLEQFMTEIRNDPDLLKRVEAMLTGSDPMADLQRAFGGELVMGRYAIQNLESTADLLFPGEGGKEPKRNVIVDRLLKTGNVRQMFEAKWCEAWRLSFEKMPKGKNDWRSLHAVVEETSQRVENDKSLDNLLNRIFFPVFTQASKALGKQLAERRLELLSLKLLQARGQGLPSDLKSYGELGIDPFTGRPMGYEKNGKAFRIWSVGPDMTDDGGVARKLGAGSGQRGFDIVMGFDMVIRQVEPHP